MCQASEKQFGWQSNCLWLPDVPHSEAPRALVLPGGAPSAAVTLGRTCSVPEVHREVSWSYEFAMFFLFTKAEFSMTVLD